MTTISIRRAVAERDYQIMLDITHRALREIAISHYPLDHVDQSIAEGAWTLKRDLLERGNYFVAEVEQRICGGIGWDTIPLWDKLDTLPFTASLRGLYIDPATIGKGIGSRLLDYCINDIRAAGFQHVELFASLMAESLFARFGFVSLSIENLVLSDGVTLPGKRMHLDLLNRQAS